jgi:hypothetical protein
MARATILKAKKTPGREAKAPVAGKHVIVPATTWAVLKTHGHTLKSATHLKAKLDRQLAHAGGK